MVQNDSSVSSRPVTIPDTEVHTISSKYVGEELELWVGLPQKRIMPPGQRVESFDEETPYVLYLLDANLYFGTAVEMTRLMHRLFGELPPFLIVGIAYPTDDAALQGKLRTRDFTPSKDIQLLSRFTPSPQDTSTAERMSFMGGASSFLHFFNKEVIPFTKTHYEVKKDGSALFGSSLGGLFVTYAFFESPSSIDNYISVSPALWWNQEEIFDYEMNLDQLAGATLKNVFIGVGEREESPDIPGLSMFKMVTNADRMALKLSEGTPSSVSVFSETIADETHTSVVPVALTRALRKLYELRAGDSE